MKNKIILALVFVVPLIIYFGMLIINPDTTLEESALANSKLPKVLVFSTAMCGECKKLQPVLDQAKQDYQGRIDFFKINAIDGKRTTEKLTKEYKVYVVPTLIYLDKDGQFITRSEGSMSYDELKDYLKDIE